MIDKMNYSMIAKLISNVDAGLLFCKNDPHSTILYSNDYFFEMIGYTREEVEQLFQNRFAEMVIDNVPDILVKVKRAVELGEHLDYEYRMRRKDGTIMWIHDTAVYEKEHDAFYVVIMDITEKKSIQYQMEKLLWILDHIPNKIMIANSSDQKIDYVNTEVLNCEYLNEEPIEGNLLECVVGGHIIGQNFREIWKKALLGQVVSYETRFQEEEDTIIGHEKNYLVPILDHEKKIISVMQVSEDLMKQNDALTALSNRTMFENYYKEQRALGQENFDMTLFMIDIDDFKTINDVYGHDAGDLAIKRIAKCLIGLLHEEDYASRCGGDEFVLLLKTCERERINFCIQKIMNFTKEPICIGGHQFYVTYSIGIASTNGESIEYNTLFKYADIALYKAKHNGKRGYMIYEAGMLDRNSFEQFYVKEFQWYIKNDVNLINLEPYTKRNLKEKKEILEPNYNLTTLSENLRKFLIEKEEEITRYVDEEIYESLIDEILKKYFTFLQESENYILCINLPIGLLEKGIFMQKVPSILQRNHCPKERVLFKIIEMSKLKGYEEAHLNFIEAKAAGLKFMLGDFGEELDSFKILLDFPTEYISVDSVFVDQCIDNARYKTILDTIFNLASLNESIVVLQGKCEKDWTKLGHRFDYQNEHEKVYVNDEGNMISQKYLV